MKTDLALLLLRVAFGGMMLFGHGLGKFQNFSSLATGFPDPIGLGPTVSATLAVFAEVVCSALLIAGFATRLAAIPLVITMVVAAGIVHAGDPWAKKEFAICYLVPFLALMLTGAGRFSLDHLKSRFR